MAKIHVSGNPYINMYNHSDMVNRVNINTKLPLLNLKFHPNCHDYCILFINTLRPRQNGRHFADDTFKCIFVNKNVRIFIEISLKFVPKGPINNIPALVQIMVWRRTGAKPLSEPAMLCLPKHICVTRPQWVNVQFLLSNQYNKIASFKRKLGCASAMLLL